MFHQLSRSLSNALLRRLAPTDPARRLPATKMQELAPRMHAFDRWAALLCFASLVVLTVSLTAALYFISRGWQAPADAPVFDSRGPWEWTACGLVLAIIATYVPYRLFARWWWRSALDLHDRYEATSKGFDEQRLMRKLAAVGLLVAIGFGVLAWRAGEVIDARAIRFWDGPLNAYDHTYDEVTSVALYDGFRAPIGVRQVFNLQVDFTDGPPFRLLSDARPRSPDVLERIAAHVSERSGVPVTHGRMRPDD